MASREELSGKKASELQQMLEDRGLDPSGKKSELVERLLKASGAGNGSRGADGEAKPPSAAAPGPMAAGSGDPQSLLLQLRILKEKEALTEQEISNRARMEQEQARIDARRQQLVLEERLAEIGSPVADADLRSAAINVSERAPERAGAADALAQHIQRSLLPRAELSPFSGNVQEYRLFLRTFDMCVANRTTDQNELLAYLEQFTRGRPNRLVRNCLHLGESGYQRARSALEREYGNPHVLIDSYVNKLRSWPKVASGDVQGLDQLVLFLVEVENAMTTISMGELEHPRTLREVVQKLPTCLRDRWLREADRLMEQGRDGSNFGFVGFGHLVDFLERELRVLKNPVFGVSSSRSSDGHGSQKVNAVTFSGARPSCSFCKGSHHLDLCDKLRFRPYSERKTFIQERRLCFGCLQPGHQARFCKSRLTCQVCGSRHASLLHRTADQGTAARAVGAADSPAPGAEVRPKVVSAGVGVQPVSGASATMMPVLPVSLRGKGGREVLTNAFLDQGSSGSFITSRLAGQLGLDKEEVSIRIDTVTGVGQEARSAVMRGAEVSPIGSDECFALPPLFTLDSIPVSLQDRCEGADRNQWEHLADLPMCELEAPVEVMIGSNAAPLLAAREVRLPPAGVGPVGVRTCLGWYVIGPRRPGAGGDSRFWVNFLRVCEPRSGSREDLVDMFNSMYESEFGDVSEESEQFSVSDCQWLKEVSSIIRKDDENHYEVALPKVVGVEVPEVEVKRSIRVCQAALADVEGGPSDALVRHYSSFYRLKRAVAWLHRLGEVIRSGAYRRFCVARRKGLRVRKPDFRVVLELSDLQKAEMAVLRYAQCAMPEYPGGLVADGPLVVKKGSSLCSLAPQMSDGLLVVGGRLSSSPSLSERSKHPVIVPRRHHVARLLLRDAHVAAGHQGRDHTLWKLRERYWIVGASSDVRKMIRSCVVCRKANARPQEQLMASLPESRVTAGTGAFEKVGLDVFGPFLVKSGRSERKRFGLMCTCLVTRAVHVEVLCSLTADSLINAVRRISARRGAIRYVISDRGTNLVGADRELREALREVDYDRLHGESVKHGIHWEFNPPTASHFSGATERQIRTFRKIMRSMPQQRLDDETLQTLFCEIEAVINSRPLNYVSTSDGNVEPISPNHLLLLRGNASGEPGEFSENDSFSRRKWRHVQYLASQFWRRWLAEYVPTLQTRQKWRQAGRNLQTGDIVLVLDKDLPRGSWPLGRIVRVFPSADRLVRKALVRTSTSTYLRPIHKMVLVHSDSDLDW